SHVARVGRIVSASRIVVAAASLGSGRGTPFQVMLLELGGRDERRRFKRKPAQVSQAGWCHLATRDREGGARCARRWSSDGTRETAGQNGADRGRHQPRA